MDSTTPPLDDEQTYTVQLLRELLPEVPHQEFVLVASHCPIQTVGARETVFRQGNKAEGAVLVLRGLLRATAHGASSETTLNVIRRGELCGESALYALDTIRIASVHAVEPSVLLQLTPTSLEQLSGTHFLAWLQTSLLMSTARRLRTNRLVIRRTWMASTPVEPPTDDQQPVEVPEAAADKPKSWWKTLRSSLKSLA